MKASPIPVERSSLESTTAMSSADQAASIGIRTTVPSFFRTDLLQSLSEGKKAFHLKFEVLNRSNLLDITKFGCRIMFIQSEMISPDGVIVESADCRPELIKYSEFREMLPKCQQTQSAYQSLNNSIQIEHPQNIKPTSNNLDKPVDLLIVGTKNDLNTAIFLSKELKIPHVVAFSFKRDIPGGKEENNKKFPSVDSNPFRRKLYEDECVEKFCGYFFNELIDGCSVKQAFENAKREMIDCISFSFFDSKDEQVTEILGEGPILLPKYDDRGNEVHHDDFLFGVDDYVLQGGKVEDISNVRFPTNVHKSLIPFTGRIKEMDETMKKLLKPKDNILLLTGEAGVGKTRFILEVAYRMLVRNFFADGIFYFPLRKLKKKNIFEMIKETINSEAFGSKMEYNLKNLFRNKKMLLIFDDIDVFFENDIEFPSLVFSILQKSHIATVLIQREASSKAMGSVTAIDKKFSKTNIDMADLYKKINEDLVKERLKLERLTDLETAHLFVSLLEQNVKFELTPTEALAQPWIRSAKGNPSRLIRYLNDGKITWKGRQLQLNPVYSDFLSRKSGVRVRTSQVPHWCGSEDDPSGGLILTFSRHCSQCHSTMKSTKRSSESVQINNIGAILGGVTMQVPFPLEDKNQLVNGLEYKFHQPPVISPVNVKRPEIRTRTQEAFEMNRQLGSKALLTQELRGQQSSGKKSKKHRLKRRSERMYESDSSDEQDNEEEERKERIIRSRKQIKRRNLRGIEEGEVGGETGESYNDGSELESIMIGGAQTGNPSNRLPNRRARRKSSSPENRNGDTLESLAEHESGGFSVNDEETQHSESFSSDSESNDAPMTEKTERMLFSTPLLRPVKIADVRNSPKVNMASFMRLEELAAIQQMKSPKHIKAVSMIPTLPNGTIISTVPAGTSAVYVRTSNTRLTPKITQRKTLDLQSQLIGLVRTPPSKPITANMSSPNNTQTPATNAVFMNIQAQAGKKVLAQQQQSSNPTKSPITKPLQAQNFLNVFASTPKPSAFKTDRQEKTTEETKKKLRNIEKPEEQHQTVASPLAGLTLRKIDRK